MVNVLNNKKLMYFMLFFLIIQLERAWNSLKWNEKLNLLINVIRGITSPSDMSLDNLKVFLLLKDVLHFFSCQLTLFSCAYTTTIVHFLTCVKIISFVLVEFSE